MANYFKSIFDRTSSKRGTIQAPKQDFNDAWMNYYSMTKNGSVDVNNVDKINVVFTAIKILAENISRLDILVKKNGKVKTNYTNHYLFDLLKFQPNNYQSIETFLQIITTHLYMKGNAFAWIKKVKGLPSSLEVINYDYITDAKLINGNLWYYSKSDDMVWPAENILHFKLPVNKNGFFATNPIEALRINLNIGYKAEQTVNNLYEKNAQGTLILETTAEQANKKIDEAVEKFKEKYMGYKNAGEIIVPPPLTTLREIKLNVEDAKFLQSAVHSEQTIASAFGLPVSMFGHTDSKYGNYQEGALNFKQNTMSALMNVFASELNFKLLPIEERKKGVEIEFDAEQLIDTNLIEKANVHKILKDAGAMSINEMANKWGLDGVKGDIGNMHFVQSQYIPLEEYDKYASNKPQQPVTNNQEEKVE